MTLPRPALFAVLTLLPLLVACDDGPAAPDGIIARAVIAPGGSDPEVSVSQQGNAFVIEITSWGNPCMSAHHDDVVIDSASRTIVVTPYDEEEPGFCFASLGPIAHVVTVEPPLPGDWLIRVVGSYILHGEDVVVERAAAYAPIVIDNPNAG